MGLNDTYRTPDPERSTPVVVALFNRGEDAQQAIADLREYGFRPTQIGAAFREPPARVRRVESAPAERTVRYSNPAATPEPPRRGGERWWERLKQSFYEEGDAAAPGAAGAPGAKVRYNNTESPREPSPTAGRFITARDDRAVPDAHDEYEYATNDFETSLSHLGIPPERAEFLAQNLVEGGAIVSVRGAERAREAELILERNQGLVRYEGVPLPFPARERRSAVGDEDYDRPRYADHVPYERPAERATVEDLPPVRERRVRPDGPPELRRGNEIADRRRDDDPIPPVRERTRERVADVDQRRADEYSDRAARQGYDRPRADELRNLRQTEEPRIDKPRGDELRARRSSDAPPEQPLYDRRRADERPPRPGDIDDGLPGRRRRPDEDVVEPVSAAADNTPENRTAEERIPESGIKDPQRMQLFGEMLRVHKDRFDRGEVRVRKELVTETQTVQVPVTREELVIERNRAEDGPVAADDPFGGEREMRIPLSGDAVRVEKEPVLREEVILGKREVADTQSIEDDVRREELRVDDRGLKDLGSVRGTDASVRRPA